MSRPKALVYAGDGSRFFYGVPARDLDETDIAGLSDDQLAEITGPNPETGKPLYHEPKPAAAAKPEKAAGEAKSGKEG